jgi:hypothetical protein
MNAVEILTGKMVEASEAYRRGEITAEAANADIAIYAEALTRVLEHGSALNEKSAA